jgi:WhiB family transcriptional regulator, redox-sensing transcriptional regulator
VTLDTPFFGGMPDRERLIIAKMGRWIGRAACREEPDPGYLAERTGNAVQNKNQEQRAKEICAECPVRIECLDHAMTVPESGGIWGGLNDRERDHLAKRLNKPEHKVLRR